MLVDSLYYFQKLKSPPYGLLSLLIDALKSAFTNMDTRGVVSKVI